MSREVVIERGDPQVQSEGVPQESDKGAERGQVLHRRPLRHVRADARKVNPGGKKPRPNGDEGRADQEVSAKPKTPPEDFRLGVDWDACALDYGQKVLEVMLAEMEKGRTIMRDRIAQAAKLDMRCSNPACRKALGSERSCVSIFQVRDPKTWVERTVYSCSARCHAVNHKLAAEEKVIKT